MFPHSNIVSLFHNAAAKYPATTAIIHNSNSITYNQLASDVKATAAYFAGKGVLPGDRVLVFVPMSLDLYRIVLALFHVGATAVFLDEWVSLSRMEICCKIAQCKGFISSNKIRLLSWFSPELRKIPVKLSIHLKSKNSGLAVFQSKNEDTALITFTTGSTGTPKAANRTHGFLKEQFKVLKEKIKAGHGDMDMSLLPIVLLINLACGATSVIADFKAKKPGRFKPDRMLEQIKKHQVQRITASPFFIKALATYIIKNKIEALPVKQIFTGGAPVFPAEAALFTNAFPDAHIEIIFGSTEAEPISAISASELLQKQEKSLIKGLPVGRPDPNTEVKIIEIQDAPISVNDSGDLPLLSSGEVGEIIVAGAHVLKAYYNNDEAFKRNKIVVNGTVYHRTGDSGFLDENKQLYLTGRCNAIFECEGKSIYPFLFENFCQSLHHVSAGTILKLNGKVLVILEHTQGSDKQLLETKVRTQGISFDQIVFLKNIPRDPRHHSKIDYDKLKQKIKDVSF